MTYRAIQIRDIINRPDGGVDIQYTEGFAPLPTGAGGGESFPSLAQLQAEIKELQSRLPAKDFMLMALAQFWLKSDGTFGNVNQVTNKQLQWDPTAPTPWRVV